MADFNYYLNYHRPCGFATVEVKDNGKRRRYYRPDDYCTPYGILTFSPSLFVFRYSVVAAHLFGSLLRRAAVRVQPRTGVDKESRSLAPPSPVGISDRLTRRSA